jgi:UDP-N-acetylmuramate dehydrogenase
MTLSFDAPNLQQSNLVLDQQPIHLDNSDCIIRPQVPLAPMTTWRVGGPAEWYVEPHTIEDIQGSLLWAKANGIKVMTIGAGSNLLVSDRGLPGLIICTRHLRNIKNHFDTDLYQLTAGAGKMIGSVAWQAARKGWSGLEWAAGIPGTVGGAVVMNGGAHGRCAGDVLVKTKVLMEDGSIVELTPADLGYSYRTSNLQGSPHMVLEATFQLTPQDSPKTVIDKTHRDLEKRHSTQPYDQPSCGSVFRNPLPHHSAQLVESIGLKGYRIGGAEVSTLHANFIINRGNATANDILGLINYVRDRVHQHYGIELETEVKILGEFDLSDQNL